MSDTREKILQTALSLFAKDGYEAVSVSDIAGELGMTKGALYRHYTSKKDILDSIAARMAQLDAEQTKTYSLPEATAAAIDRGSVTVDGIISYGGAMFRFWAADGFASRFRRLLTLEQFRSEEMGALYQQYLVSGPMVYLSRLFAALGLAKPHRAAVEFYSPLFLLFGVYDGAPNSDAVLAAVDDHLESSRNKLRETTKYARRS